MRLISSWKQESTFYYFSETKTSFGFNLKPVSLNQMHPKTPVNVYSWYSRVSEWVTKDKGVSSTADTKSQIIMSIQHVYTYSQQNEAKASYSTNLINRECYSVSTSELLLPCVALRSMNIVSMSLPSSVFNLARMPLCCQHTKPCHLTSTFRK